MSSPQVGSLPDLMPLLASFEWLWGDPDDPFSTMHDQTTWVLFALPLLRRQQVDDGLGWGA